VEWGGGEELALVAFGLVDNARVCAATRELVSLGIKTVPKAVGTARRPTAIPHARAACAVSRERPLTPLRPPRRSSDSCGVTRARHGFARSPVPEGICGLLIPRAATPRLFRNEGKSVRRQKLNSAVIKRRAQAHAMTLYRYLDRLLGQPQNYDSADPALAAMIMSANRLIHRIRRGPRNRPIRARRGGAKR
jgi:hypothetical protein